MTDTEQVWPLLMKTGIYDDLKGVIDIHIHPNPDFCERLLDDDEVASLAKSVGMRAIMIKSHFSATHERAYLAEKAVGGGIRVFGLICLNPSVGGLSPDSVRIALKQGARAVWMPSMWTEHHAGYVRSQGSGMGYQTIGMQFTEPGHGLSPLDANGRVKDNVKAILDQVAAADVMLASGHFSLPEVHAVMSEAKARGVTRSVIHTANYHVMHFPEADMLQMVNNYGAVLEMGFSSLPNGVWDPEDTTRAMSAGETCRLIRVVGAQNVVLTSDCGQLSTAMPIEAMRLWISHMKTYGISQPEIDEMTKIVPARLLGLDKE